MHQYASRAGQEASLAVRPFRAILSTAKRRAPSAHEAADGYAAPRPPAHLAYAYCLSFLLFLWPGVLSKKTDKKYENGYT